MHVKKIWALSYFKRNSKQKMTATIGCAKQGDHMVGFDAQDMTIVSIPLLPLEKSMNCYNVTTNFP